MRALIATFTTLVLVLGAGLPAWAQGGVLDVLTDILGGKEQLRGHVVSAHDTEVVVRGTDGRTYAIDASSVDEKQRRGLQPGQPVKVKLQEGGRGRAPVAASLEVEGGERKTFRTVTGTVESTSNDQVRFRTSDGLVVPVDLGRIVGPKPSLRTGETATLTYEQTAQNALVGVWLEPRTGAPAASPPTSEPGRTPGGWERIHGFVESIGVGTLTLKTDEGRTMTVDVGQARGATGDIRPGDLVSVVGRASGSDRFVAEMIQKDAARR